MHTFHTRNLVYLTCATAALVAGLLGPATTAHASGPRVGAPTAAYTTATWGICGLWTPDTKVIRTFNRYRAIDGIYFMRGGTAYLACGNTFWGYRHILARHLNEWQSQTFLSGDNWRDLADTAIQSILIDPDVTRYRSLNNSFCYSRAIFLFNNRTKQKVSTIYPNVVVGAQDGRIITAFPSKTQCKSG